jgi:DNA-binding beta-propeller fold protein YncE
MRKAKALAVLALVAVVGGVWVYSGGCDRPKPNEPVEPDEPKDYIVYTSDDYSHTVFGYHTLTRQVDSMYTPFSLRHGVTVSADGKRLFISSDDPVVVVDTDSLGFITELCCSGHVAVSPDNRYLALQWDTLRILDTRDYSLVFMDTIPVGGGVFTATGNTFYAVRENRPDFESYLYKLDLAVSDPMPVVQVFEDANVQRVVPTPDEKKLLLLVYGPLFPIAFAVYDIAADSIVHEHGVYGGTHYIAVTPDGRYAFHGNPSGSPDGYGRSEIVVFDIPANRVDRVVRTDFFIDSVTPPIFEVGSMAITPDGRWLAALTAPAPYALLLFDIQQMSPVDYWIPDPANKWFRPLSVQTIM